MVLLSICLPTYNRKKALQQVVDQLLVHIQGYNDIEICISDNHSVDGTSLSLIGYKTFKNNVKININDKNIGYDLNLVKVLRMATGKYCWTIGDDDLINKEAIDNLMIILKSGEFSLGLMNAGDDQEMADLESHFTAGVYSHSGIKNNLETEYLEYLNSVQYNPSAFGFMSCCIFNRELIQDGLKLIEENKGAYNWAHLVLFLGSMNKKGDNFFQNKESIISNGASLNDKIFFPDEEINTFIHNKTSACDMANISSHVKYAITTRLEKEKNKAYLRAWVELCLIKDIIPEKMYNAMKENVLKNENPKENRILINMLKFCEQHKIIRTFMGIVPKLNNYAKRVKAQQKGLVFTNAQREGI